MTVPRMLVLAAITRDDSQPCSIASLPSEAAAVLGRNRFGNES